MTQTGDVAVRLDGARKLYGEVVAVDRVDLDIREDEFFTLLGPSGSGKTTCLRMIAGFERPDQGRVEPSLRAGRQHRVPGPRALSAHERGRERGIRPARGGHRQGGPPPARGGRARAGAPRRLREAPPGPPLGRPAPARGARACAREPPARATARRAARCARSEAAASRCSTNGARSRATSESPSSP